MKNKRSAVTEGVNCKSQNAKYSHLLLRALQSAQAHKEARTRHTSTIMVAEPNLQLLSLAVPQLLANVNFYMQAALTQATVPLALPSAPAVQAALQPIFAAL